jgi:epoxyqueuosine reductase
MNSLTQSLKAKATELGFDKATISRAEALDARNGLESWLAAGHHGEMLWMSRDPRKRLDPRKMFAEARSVIALAVNYYTPENHSEDPDHGKISRYAWGNDYHRVVKERLNSFMEWIVKVEPTAQGLCCCDTGPIMDKAWAHRSGLGWIGKHSNLITRELGSWIFLGEIILNLELEYDSEGRSYCGTCQRCLDVCPTQAIVAPYVVDARRCISYLTIELRGPIPREFRAAIGSRIFGCDDCQDVCPWNRFAQISPEPDFYPAPGNRLAVLTELMRLTEDEFRTRFRRSSIKRTKYAGFLRNVAVALGNSRNPNAVPVLVEGLSHSQPLVRAHVAWALGEIGGEVAQKALETARLREQDPEVTAEMDLALSQIASPASAGTANRPSQHSTSLRLS